jgi:hypothetical protein
VNTDGFFAKIDARLHKEAETDAASLKIASKDREFLEQVIARLIPLVASYEAKLKERGIDTKVDSCPTGISVTLRYKDGGHNGLYIGGSPKSYLIELKTSFIEDGQNYIATKSYDHSNWQDSIFEARLQRLIEDFLLYADKHGDIHS